MVAVRAREEEHCDEEEGQETEPQPRNGPPPRGVGPEPRRGWDRHQRLLSGGYRVRVWWAGLPLRPHLRVRLRHPDVALHPLLDLLIVSLTRLTALHAS